MKRSSARARRLPVVNLWPGLIIELNILLPTRDDMLSLASLVHLSSLSMPLFPFAAIRFLALSLQRESPASSLPGLPISPPDFFFFFLLFLPNSALRVPRLAPYPSFLLARRTKMGPAASGSRFPRKLSSYKINYPPYFIAPRRSGPFGVRVDVSR